MKNLRNFIACLAMMMSILLLFVETNAQVQTEHRTSIIVNARGFYEYLPQGYGTENKRYPLLIFVHGIGELGDGSTDEIELVLRNGPPRLIKDGKFPTSFKVRGEEFKFIVISPQFHSWPTSEDIDDLIAAAKSKYKVDESRIYLTGLSMGGGVVWEYVSAKGTYANTLAAIVPVCGVAPSNEIKGGIIAASNLPVWATHNDGDETVEVKNTNNFIYYINNSKPPPTPLAKKTIFRSDSHDAWSVSYDPSFKENGMNIYEWMLQYKRGTGAPSQPANQVPSANAGSDITINLPVNSVTLNGSGSDPDGSISKYSWSKVSGPGQFAISSTSVANPTISNLAEGQYVLRLTVTDDDNATDTDDLVVKVNPAPPNQVPSANAGSDITISLPVNSVALNGSGSDPDGSINKYNWSKVSGPPEFAISSTSVANPTISNLAEGEYVLRLTVTDDDNATDTDDVVIKVNAAPAVTAIPVPGIVQAESYFAMNGVQVQSTTDFGGGSHVTAIDNGDWMDFRVNVAVAGAYNLNLRVATPNNNQQFQIRKPDGTVLATVNVPRTGGNQVYTITGTLISLAAGTQTLRFHSLQSGWSINWSEFNKVNDAISLPGKLQAEDYTSMSGIDVENTTDTEGGRNVGWLDIGDWMDYKVSVAHAGNYTVRLRVATPYVNQRFQIRKQNGAVLATVNLSPTGGHQSWTTVNTSVTLDEGDQVIRIHSLQSGWNINWAEFVLNSSFIPVPGTLEASKFSAMAGVKIEESLDDNQGWNIGWIDNGDWMDYTVNAANAATYKVSFRVASAYQVQRFQVKNQAGSVLATINVPQTGGNQLWTTVTANIPLPKGNQTIRINSLGSGWNITKMEFSTDGPLASQSSEMLSLSAMEEELFDKPSFTMFPNPVQNHVNLKVQNSFTGPMEVQIIDAAGIVSKTYKYSKNQPFSQINLPVKELQAGTYIIRIKMNEWSEMRKLIKL